MSSVRSRSESWLCAADQPIRNRRRAGPPRPSQRQGNRRRFGQNPDALYALSPPPHVLYLFSPNQSGIRRVRGAHQHASSLFSRRERFETLEKSALKALPVNDFDSGEWSEATLHADSYVLVEAVFYSAPHIHRHKKLRIKLTENRVEIFLNLERLAVHPRCRHRDGRRIKIEAHFPPASQAYYEATPQKLLSQSRFIHPELHRLFVELFDADIYGHLRRCQGFVRSCTKEINSAGHEAARVRIASAIAAYFAQGRPAFHGMSVHGFTPGRSSAREAGRSRLSLSDVCGSSSRRLSSGPRAGSLKPVRAGRWVTGWDEGERSALGFSDVVTT